MAHIEVTNPHTGQGVEWDDIELLKTYGASEDDLRTAALFLALGCKREVTIDPDTNRVRIYYSLPMRPTPPPSTTTP